MLSFFVIDEPVLVHLRTAQSMGRRKYEKWKEKKDNFRLAEIELVGINKVLSISNWFQEILNADRHKHGLPTVSQWKRNPSTLFKSGRKSLELDVAVWW